MRSDDAIAALCHAVAALLDECGEGAVRLGREGYFVTVEDGWVCIDGEPVGGAGSVELMWPQPERGWREDFHSDEAVGPVDDWRGDQ